MIEGREVYRGIYNGIDLLIRYCNHEDVKQLMDFINTLSLEQTFITFQGEQMTLEDEEKYVEGFLKKTEDRRAIKLLAFHKNELVGVCDITPREKKIENHIGVLGLTIKKEWRGKGIGKLLLKTTLNEAEKNIIGMKIISLGVFANNPIAKKLYDKMGFKEYGVLPGGLQYKGEMVDHVDMYKIVRKVESS